jgi:MGT family glycosyltransferase
MVYVTFGTVADFARPEPLRAAVTAAAAHARSVLVTTGPLPPAALGPLPDAVHVHDYLPQGLALPRADAVVSHGGAGSVLGGLVHGLPQLVLPQGAPSQERIGRRLAGLGAGICLVGGEQTHAALHRAVDALLGDPAYAAAAARVSAELDRLPGVDAVAAELERRVETRG